MGAESAGMKRKLFLLLLPLMLLQALGSAAEPTERRLIFGYEVHFTDLEPGAHFRLWAPLPQNTAHQKIESLTVTPTKNLRISRDNYNNTVAFLEGTINEGGNLDLQVRCRLRRSEWTPANAPRAPRPDAFLQAPVLAPTDSRVTRVAAHLKPPAEVLESAHQLYDFVLDYMTYDKSIPGYGRGDSLFACDSRTGNCTDFHSLFTSLALARKIPVKFEIGYPIGREESGDIAGYHCWVSFYDPKNGWLPLDISEADKHAGKSRLLLWGCRSESGNLECRKRPCPQSCSAIRTAQLFRQTVARGGRAGRARIELSSALSGPGGRTEQQGSRGRDPEDRSPVVRIARP